VLPAVAARYTWFAGRCAVPALSAIGVTVKSIQFKYKQARGLADQLCVSRWHHHLRPYNEMADAAANVAVDGRHSIQSFHPTPRPEWAGHRAPTPRRLPSLAGRLLSIASACTLHISPCILGIAVQYSLDVTQYTLFRSTNSLHDTTPVTGVHILRRHVQLAAEQLGSFLINCQSFWNLENSSVTSLSNRNSIQKTASLLSGASS
jgi:hypothetical protein